MIDFILFVFVLCVFAGGFWCGRTYGSVKSMVRRGADAVKSCFE